jgi:hypothetical protein
MAGVGTHFLGVGLAVGFWSPGRADLGEVGESPTRDDLVDDPVVLGLPGGEDEVPVGVPRDLLQGLSGVPGQDLVHQVPLPKDLSGVDLDVYGLAPHLPVGLVHEDPGMGEGEPLPPGPGGQKDRGG